MQYMYNMCRNMKITFSIEYLKHNKKQAFDTQNVKVMHYGERVYCINKKNTSNENTLH